MFIITLIFLFDYFQVHTLNKLYELPFEYTSRISSLSHAIISTIMSVLFIIGTIDYNLLKYCAIYNIIHCISDINLYITNKISSHDIKEYMVHHILFILCSLSSYVNPYIYSRGIITETSTILLNIYWFFKKKNSRFSNYILILFWISFLIFRIINVNVLTYTMIYSKYSLYSILTIPVTILNNYWFYKLTLKMYRGYTEIKYK
jgi:hypothetical protein